VFIDAKEGRDGKRRSDTPRFDARADPGGFFPLATDTRT
jgi:hypothetical protein